MKENAYMHTVRRLVLPPPGFPNWLASGDPPGKLVYLAWGKRQFGRYPIERTKHDGWIYTVIISGTPVLQLRNESRKLRPGHLLIVGPDSESGWVDGENGIAEILVWVWKKAPHLQETLPPDCMWSSSVPRDSLDFFVLLHEQTRVEIRKPDNWSNRFLSAIQDQLDVAFCRSAQGVSTISTNNEARLHLATEWMRRHLNLRDPLRGLAAYLGVSSATLQRWYHANTGHSPRTIFLEIKFLEAKERLSQLNISIKQVALDLGYKHPGDFSRAYKKHFGSLPGQRFRPM